jgi:hypothetical protein
LAPAVTIGTNWSKKKPANSLSWQRDGVVRHFAVIAILTIALLFATVLLA